MGAARSSSRAISCSGRCPDGLESRRGCDTSAIADHGRNAAGRGASQLSRRYCRLDPLMGASAGRPDRRCNLDKARDQIAKTCSKGMGDGGKRAPNSGARSSDGLGAMVREEGGVAGRGWRGARRHLCVEVNSTKSLGPSMAAFAVKTLCAALGKL